MYASSLFPSSIFQTQVRQQIDSWEYFVGTNFKPQFGNTVFLW